MANDFFLRKLACDELRETLFFATGERPTKHKDEKFTLLKSGKFEAKVFTTRKIVVNDAKCNSINAAKLFIQENL